MTAAELAGTVGLVVPAGSATAAMTAAEPAGTV